MGVTEGFHPLGPYSRHRKDDVLRDSAHCRARFGCYKARERGNSVGVSEPTEPAIPHD